MLDLLSPSSPGVTLIMVSNYGSIHHEEEHPLHSPDSGRKRKLQLEQLVLPMSKPKLRHQRSSSSSSSSSFDQGSPTAHPLVPDESYEEYMDESETVPDLHEAPEQIEGSSRKGSSEGNSSSLVEASDSTMYLAGREETLPKIFVRQFETPAVPGSPQGIAFKNELYSLDSRVVKNNELPASGVDDGDGEPDCQLPVSDEGDGGYMEEEEFLYGPMEDEELMLSCDNVGLNAPGLSSTRWSIKQDALPGAARPTIDQEFEQYFSMFML